MKPSIERHLEQLYTCRRCPNVVSGPVTGGVLKSEILLVGQAPGVHEPKHDRPFAYTAGKRLFQWFASLGVDEDTFRKRVYMAAVIRCFPGKNASGTADRVPSLEEIAACGEHLDVEVKILRPKLVIAIGTLAAQQLVGDAVLTTVVGKLHRATRAGVTFDVVVLPHPSGRSTWLNKPEHQRLFERTMKLLANHEAWKRTFRS